MFGKFTRRPNHKLGKISKNTENTQKWKKKTPESRFSPTTTPMAMKTGRSRARKIQYKIEATQ